VIETRLANAFEEMRHYDEYEHCLVNDDLEAAYEILRATYVVRRDGRDAHPDLVALVERNHAKNARSHVELLLGARVPNRS
jgi:guanylate kinase